MKIFGDVFERRAEVATIGGLSAHAGQNFLIEYARAVKGQVKQIILVHGEETSARPLIEKLDEARLPHPAYPAQGQKFDIE